MDDRVNIAVTAYEDLIDRIPQSENVTIAGAVYSSELISRMLTVNSKDLVDEAASCAAWVGHWGRVAARARRYVSRAESAYRVWRERVFLECKASPVGQTVKGEDKFPTDSQAQATYRTDPQYGDWKKRIQDAQEAAEMAESIHEAFKIKGQMIRSAQSMLHDEAGGPYIVSENIRKSIPRQPKRGEF